MKVPDMQPIEKLREYTNTLCSQIRWKKAREAVSEEIYSHLMDQHEAYIQEGTTEDTATEQAIADMGDPVTVGIQLDRVHRPKPQWGMLGLILVMVAVGLCLRALVLEDLVTLHRKATVSGIQMEFVLLGMGALLVAYFADFTFMGKYPKALYFGLLALVVIMLYWETQYQTTPSLLNRYYYLSVYCSLLFPVVFSGVIYTMWGKGLTGITICLAACFLPAFLLWRGWSGVNDLFGAALIVGSGLILLGIAIMKDWFKSNLLQSRLLIYSSFLGASALLIALALRTPYYFTQIKVLLRLDSGAGGNDYLILIVKSLLSNAKLVGTGTVPAQYAAHFPLPVIQTDFFLTYLIYRMGWLAFGLVIALFIAFILIGMRQCLSQKSVLGQLVSVSVLLTFTFQTVHYIGYNLGFIFLIPMPLPFFSYGGASMVINMGLLGLMLSVFRNGSAARDRAQPSSARQPFITWRERKLVIDFGRKHGE